jgi:hypothetical protein
MDRRINPFSSLYLTETIPLSQFVKIFSPYVVDVAEELFLPGNVVLKGVQGCGKSMLLSLLKPELRIAYLRADQKFPLEGRHSMFVAGGINLTRSRAIDIGQRKVTNDDDAQRLSLFFGDFLNYWIVDDILRSIETYARESNGEIARRLRLNTSEADLDRFAGGLGSSTCWLGYLEGCDSFQALRKTIGLRIQAYFRFFQFVDELPPELNATRTAIGEPVSTVAEALKESSIVPDDVHIFVQIDQYEELMKIEAQFNRGPVYRSVVHKLLAQRTPHVSYRIGTRLYGFKEDELSVFGTTARLERDRDYKVINLDELLRRHENSKLWVFPLFAEDVFKRRMRFAGFEIESNESTLEHVFGKGSTAEHKALKYSGKVPARAIRLDPNWPEGWKDFLRNLAQSNPLSARLGEAWARQKGKGSVVQTPPHPPYPWDGKSNTPKQYWRKERVEAALMQIASRCYQRMIWSGRDDIVALSGGNVLVFVGICQKIWSVWLRTGGQGNRQDTSLPKIGEGAQAVGIHEASTQWFDKLIEESDGNTRQRFVSYVGRLLQKGLLSDDALSYPGANGFSLSLDERTSDDRVWNFLDDAVDYGALFDVPHTTKESNRKPRRKWYLNPVLSPYFHLPHIRTKEPRYVTTAEVRCWIERSVDQGIEIPADSPEPEADRASKEQFSLFEKSELSGGL